MSAKQNKVKKKKIYAQIYHRKFKNKDEEKKSQKLSERRDKIRKDKMAN